MESILTSVKKMLGISEEYTHFDTDIIIHTNTALSTLTQIGVGPTEGFFIDDDSATWIDFIPKNTNLEFIKSYVYMKVRLLFDPPTSSAVIESIKSTISELEWRIQVAVESTKTLQRGIKNE